MTKNDSPRSFLKEEALINSLFSREILLMHHVVTFYLLFYHNFELVLGSHGYTLKSTSQTENLYTRTKE